MMWAELETYGAAGASSVKAHSRHRGSPDHWDTGSASASPGPAQPQGTAPSKAPDPGGHPKPRQGTAAGVHQEDALSSCFAVSILKSQADAMGAWQEEYLLQSFPE